MKRILMLIFNVCLIAPLFAGNNAIKLNVQFDGSANPTTFNQSIHVKKQLQLEANNTNQIVMTQTVVVDNFPVTVALLVKTIAVNPNDVKLQFNLVNYGFSRGETLITQPMMVLNKNQSAKLIAGPYQLRVTANWEA